MQERERFRGFISTVLHTGAFTVSHLSLRTRIVCCVLVLTETQRRKYPVLLPTPIFVHASRRKAKGGHMCCALCSSRSYPSRMRLCCRRWRASVPFHSFAGQQ